MTRTEALWTAINCIQAGQPIPTSVRPAVLQALRWAADQADAVAFLDAEPVASDPLDYTGMEVAA